MGGQRVRGLLLLAGVVALGWWIREKRPTVSSLVDDLTRPLLGSRAAVRESEQKRVVSEASHIVTLDEEKPIGALSEGMSESEVRRILGEPDAIEPVEDERGDGVRWIYRGANRIVLFRRHRVVSISIR